MSGNVRSLSHVKAPAPAPATKKIRRMEWTWADKIRSNKEEALKKYLQRKSEQGTEGMSRTQLEALSRVQEEVQALGGFSSESASSSSSSNSSNASRARGKKGGKKGGKKDGRARGAGGKAKKRSSVFDRLSGSSGDMSNGKQQPYQQHQKGKQKRKKMQQKQQQQQQQRQRQRIDSWGKQGKGGLNRRRGSGSLVSAKSSGGGGGKNRKAKASGDAFDRLNMSLDQLGGGGKKRKAKKSSDVFDKLNMSLDQLAAL